MAFVLQWKKKQKKGGNKKKKLKKTIQIASRKGGGGVKFIFSIFLSITGRNLLFDWKRKDWGKKKDIGKFKKFKQNQQKYFILAHFVARTHTPNGG